MKEEEEEEEEEEMVDVVEGQEAKGIRGGGGTGGEGGRAGGDVSKRRRHWSAAGDRGPDDVNETAPDWPPRRPTVGSA